MGRMPGAHRMPEASSKVLHKPRGSSAPADFHQTFISLLFMNQADSHLEAEAIVGQLHPLPSLAPTSQPRNTTSWVSSNEALSFAQGVPAWMASHYLGKQAYSYQPKLGRAMPGACYSQGRWYQATGSIWFAQRYHTKASNASVAAWSTKHQKLSGRYGFL